MLALIMAVFTSCEKGIFDQVTVTTLSDGNHFHGKVEGVVQFKNYKSGFRVVDESKPMQASSFFCQFNMNKTEFDQELTLPVNGTYRVTAEITECDQQMKTTGKTISGNTITVSK